MRLRWIPDSENKIEVNSSLILFLLDCLETQKVCNSLGKTNKLYCIQPFERQTANTHIWQQKLKKTARGIMDVKRMMTHSRPKCNISLTDQRLMYCRFMWLVTGCLYQRKLFFSHVQTVQKICCLLWSNQSNRKTWIVTTSVNWPGFNSSLFSTIQVHLSKKGNNLKI